jgi:O-succinylbenzoate synthase
LAIACPKLDSNKDSYVAKITDMIDSARINTLTVVIMEVPCCGGLVQLARMATEQASRKVPVKVIVIGVQGEVKDERWI